MVKQKTTEAKPIKSETSRRKSHDVTEELKLGKFEHRTPLQLPEKQIRRGWQIVGAVLLLMMTMIGGYFLVLCVLLLDGGVMSWQAELASTPWYELVLVVAAGVMTILCFTASVMLFMKRRVPVGIWGMMIAMIIVGLVSASLHKFERYERRECYNNYPGVISMGYPCPSVVNELTSVVAADIAICAVGGLAIWGVRHAMHEQGKKKRR